MPTHTDTQSAPTPVEILTVARCLTDPHGRHRDSVRLYLGSGSGAGIFFSQIEIDRAQAVAVGVARKDEAAGLPSEPTEGMGYLKEGWLCRRIIDRLAGFGVCAIAETDSIETLRESIDDEMTRRRHAERVRSVGGDHREAAKGAKELNRAELLTKYEHLTWAKLEERIGIPESTFRDRMRDGTYDTFEGFKIFEKDKNRCMFLKSWLNKNTRVFH